jgi:hypothetical protein
MSTKVKIIVSVVIVAVSFAAGRFSTPEKTKIVTQTVEVEKKSDKTVTDSDVQVHRVVTRTKTIQPNGAQQITTTVTEDKGSDTKKAVTQDVTDDKNSTQTKETVRGDSKVTISVLGGVNVTNPSSSGMNYGLSVTKPVLGPITLGAWGLNSGVCGLSVGLTF